MYIIKIDINSYAIDYIIVNRSLIYNINLIWKFFLIFFLAHFF